MTFRSRMAAAAAVITLVFPVSLSLAGPAPMMNSALPENITSSRPWYSFSQLSQGARIYKENCAGCHGSKAEGAPNWKQKDARGRNQPPPLNGSGHAWHHRINELFDTVKYGTVRNGGGMPAWGGKLSDEEIVAVMGWFQSRWPRSLYKDWVDRPHH